MSDSLWPMDCSPPSSSAHGILQVRILEWVAISFSRRSSQPRDWTRIPHTAGGFFTVWTTREAQEYWSVCVCVCVCVKPLQSCPTLYKAVDYSLSGSFVHGILQARILERVPLFFSRGSSQSRDQTRVSFTAGIFFASWTTRDCSQDKAYQIVECLQERFL